MQLRGGEQGLTGLLHLVEGAAAVVMIVAAIGLAAAAFGPRFRLYSVVTIVVVLGFGGWSAMEIGRVGQGLATPWVGVKERIFWYSYQLWFAVLALGLLREDTSSVNSVGPPGHRCS